MIKLSTRPYSSAEEEKHLRMIPSTRSLFEGGLLLYVLLLGICALPIMLIDKWIGINSDLMFLLGFGALMLAAIILLKFYKPFEKAKKYQLMQDQVNQGFVNVAYVKPSKVFKIEAARGFPIGFYLEVDYNKNVHTLYLSGTYLNEVNDDQKFPNTEFEICRDSISEDVIDIHLYGSYFQPEQIFVGSDDTRIKMHKDGQLLSKPIDEIKTMLFTNK
jgi:hypothetical protein